MPVLDDDNLDALLRRHLSAELDPQRGRAEAAFLKHLNKDLTPTAPESYPIRPGLRPLRGWTLGLVGAGVAASVALLVAGPTLLRNLRTEAPSTNTPVVVAPPPRSDAPDAFPHPTQQSPMLRYVHSRTFDDGPTIVGGHTPARRVRYQQIEGTEWYDEQNHANVKLTVPREKTMLMEVDTY